MVFNNVYNAAFWLSNESIILRKPFICGLDSCSHHFEQGCWSVSWVICGDECVFGLKEGRIGSAFLNFRTPFWRFTTTVVWASFSLCYEF